MFKKIKKLNQKQNHTNGITLVALIITIIVLIILAGITISIALGENGIFKKSKKAASEYQKSAKAEEEELDTVYDNLESLDPNSLAAHVKVGDYVEYNPKEGVDDKELTYTSKRGSYEAKDESGKYIIGEGDNFANKSEYKSEEGYHYNAKGFLYKDAGSIIDENGNLTKGNGESGSGSTATTGEPLSTDQKFTVKEDNNLKWRVLSIENGCVNLVCSSTINEDTNDEYDLYGITGYNYGVQELNNICSIYGYGKGAKSARSINVDDVNKLTKYNPSEKFSNYGELKGWGEENNTHEWKDTYYWYTTNSSADSNQYYHKVDDETVLDVLFKDDNSSPISYWLASRYVDAGDSNAGFGLRYVRKSDVDNNYDDLFYCYPDGNESFSDAYYSVRPVVTLRSEVKYDSSNNSNRDGSKDNPYKFTFDENSYGE